MSSGGTCSECAIAGTAVFSIVVSSDSMKKPTATSQGRSRFAAALGGASIGCCASVGCCAGMGCCAGVERLGQSGVHNALGFLKECAQVLRVAKALGVDLVNILGARWARREPAVLG